MSEPKKLFIKLSDLEGEFKVQLTHTITLLIVGGSYMLLSYILTPLLIAGTLSCSMLLIYNLILTLSWMLIFKIAGKAYRQFLFSMRLGK